MATATGLDILADDEDAYTGPLSDKGLSSTFDRLGSSLGSAGSRVGAGLLGGFQTTRLGAALFGPNEANQQAANDRYLQQDLRRRTAELRYSTLQSAERRAVAAEGRAVKRYDEEKTDRVTQREFAQTRADEAEAAANRAQTKFDWDKSNHLILEADLPERLQDLKDQREHARKKREHAESLFEAESATSRAALGEAELKEQGLSKIRNQIVSEKLMGREVEALAEAYAKGTSGGQIQKHRIYSFIERTPLAKEMLNFKVGAHLFIEGGADPEKLSDDYKQWESDNDIEMVKGPKGGFQLVDMNDINPETGKPIVLAFGKTKADVYNNMGLQINDRSDRIMKKATEFFVHEESDGASWGIDILKRWAKDGFIKTWVKGELTWGPPDLLRSFDELNKMIKSTDGEKEKRHFQTYSFYSMLRTLPPEISGFPESAVTNREDLEKRTKRMRQYAKNNGIEISVKGIVDQGTGEETREISFKHDSLTGGEFMPSKEFLKLIEGVNPIVKKLLTMERNIKKTATAYYNEIKEERAKDSMTGVEFRNAYSSRKLSKDYMDIINREGRADKEWLALFNSGNDEDVKRAVNMLTWRIANETLHGVPPKDSVDAANVTTGDTEEGGEKKPNPDASGGQVPTNAFP